MTPDDGPTTADHDLATELAAASGALLLEVRGEGLEGKELKDAGDLRSHEHLMAALAERAPDDGVLSEEGADDPARLDKRRVWIVDPLDGTREFSELDRSDWAVHVALAIDGVVVAGAVALPALGRTYSTAVIPEVPLVDRAPRILVSRTRPTEHARLIAEKLDGELVPMGSAGAKAMAVVRGEADIYAHSGGQYEWDSAAPVAVAQAAGLHVSRLDGSPMRYNQPNPWLPDLLICRPELAERVLAIGLPSD
ncbi:MAG TPA: 3'(2'),5'-bisphosphate nucleotidase CysQ [Acidimicrobiales bacterium]